MTFAPTRNFSPTGCKSQQASRASECAFWSVTHETATAPKTKDNPTMKKNTVTQAQVDEWNKRWCTVERKAIGKVVGNAVLAGHNLPTTVVNPETGKNYAKKDVAKVTHSARTYLLTSGDAVDRIIAATAAATGITLKPENATERAPRVEVSDDERRRINAEAAQFALRVTNGNTGPGSGYRLALRKYVRDAYAAMASA